MVFEMAQVGGNNVFVAADTGADGSAVRGGMQGEQGGGKGFGRGIVRERGAEKERRQRKKGDGGWMENVHE